MTTPTTPAPHTEVHLHTHPHEQKPKVGFFHKFAMFGLTVISIATGTLYFREKAKNKRLDKKFGKWKRD
jgi:hypothetical protein